MNDAHDSTALQHYMALIEQRYPPDLAVALAAARYQLAVGMALPVVRETLVRVQEQHPDLKRDVGRTVAAIDRKGTINPRNNRRS